MKPVILLVLAVMLSVAVQGYFLEEEAGISVYANVGPITLADALPAYHTIEYQDENYIIGQVDVGYGEEYYAHVYTHKDGWIVAYYLDSDPTAKMISWNDYQGGVIPPSKLEAALDTVAAEIGVGVANITYYDFRYPAANKLMMMIERSDGDLTTDTFQVKIPSDFAVYDRSWSLHGYDIWGEIYYLDGNNIATMSDTTNNLHLYMNGVFASSQLEPDLYHTIGIYNDEYSDRTGYTDGALTLTYTEP